MTLLQSYWEFHSGIRYACTSSREADWGLARLAAADREGVDADGLAVTSLFLSFSGLSRESSTVPSVREKKKPDWGHSKLNGNVFSPLF